MTAMLPKLALIPFLAACSAAGQPDPPTHVVVVCTKTCDLAARRELFRAWADRSLDRPGSQFEVWGAGGEHLYAAQVPARWQAPVTRSRAAFLAAGDAQSDAAFSAGRGSITADADIHVLGDAELERAVRAGIAATAPAHVAIVCDRSSSTNGISCEPSIVRETALAWLARGGVREGASFEILVPGQGYDSARRIADWRIDARAVGARVAGALTAVDALADAVTRDHGTAGSAIVETLRLAGEHLADRPGVRSLVVLSDLRQYTPGRWNFERSVPAPASFSRWLAKEGLSPDLRGVTVTACGTHHMPGKGAAAYRADVAQRVVALWGTVFKAAGGADARIASDCADLAMRAVPPPGSAASPD